MNCLGKKYFRITSHFMYLIKEKIAKALLQWRSTHLSRPSREKGTLAKEKEKEMETSVQTSVHSKEAKETSKAKEKDTSGPMATSKEVSQEKEREARTSLKERKEKEKENTFPTLEKERVKARLHKNNHDQ